MIALSAISGKAVVRGCSLGKENCYYLVAEPPKKNLNVMAALTVAIIGALDGVPKRFFVKIMEKNQIRSVRTMQCKKMTCGERKKFCRECEYHQPTWKYRFVISLSAHTGSGTALFGRSH